ncbi:MAG: nitrous oxide reductase family maturation protein NosD [Ectothiorhodospiraceae bacterium]|nr:nitrous oxide reductase family maturation protein NosD [Ectothiorhodospiraceae bacterium]
MTTVYKHAFFCLIALLLLVDLAGAAQRTSPDDGPLQARIDAANAGEVLVLAPGVYPGGVTIDKPLTLRGEPGAVIDAGGQGDVVRVEAEDVRIEGLVLRNSGFNLTDMNAGVHGARGAHRLHVEGNILEDVAFGVWAWHLEDVNIIDNRIASDPSVRSQDRGDAIRLFNVRHGLVAYNTVRDARDGVYIDTSEHVEFRGNHFSALRYAIHYMYSHHGRIVDNTTTDTRSGYALMMSNHLEVTGNRSVGDRNYGFLLNFVNHSKVADNLVDRVTGWSGATGAEHGVTLGSEGKAIFIYNSQSNDIRNNIFANSEIGIHLTAGSEGNRIHGNNFIGNRTQVMYVATRKQDWSYEGQGNYWSDYLGWDLQGDGVGDHAYEPNDSVDRLLWMYPMARVLMNSPAVQLLRWVQREFPILRPSGVKDSAPLMRPTRSLEELG